MGCASSAALAAERERSLYLQLGAEKDKLAAEKDKALLRSEAAAALFRERAHLEARERAVVAARLEERHIRDLQTARLVQPPQLHAPPAVLRAMLPPPQVLTAPAPPAAHRRAQAPAPAAASAMSEPARRRQAKPGPLAKPSAPPLAKRPSARPPLAVPPPPPATTPAVQPRSEEAAPAARRTPPVGQESAAAPTPEPELDAGPGPGPEAALAPAPKPGREPSPVVTPALELKHDFFLSHYQATGGDQVMTLELKLSNLGFDCWLDQNAASITKQSMQAGVAESRVFLLFLSEGVLARPFCIFEIETAMGLDKPIMLMHETDARHGAFDFAEASAAPPHIASLALTHESLPWRRRRFEQDALLQEFVKNSGLAEARHTPGVGGAATGGTGTSPVQAAAAAAAAGDAAGLAPVPMTAPVLPDVLNPRPTDQSQVLDVLLGRTEAGRGASKVLAHGMGGLGKTTMSASIVRLDAVRSRFDRITFVAAGQEPSLMELQKAMYQQLVGPAMEEKSEATVASQRELLQAKATGQRWLVVLDDLWLAEHERLLNFVDPSAAPESKVFVTTRFAKLFPGYVEVALGLLAEGEAVELLLGTAELDVAAATPAQLAAARTICKQAGHLPLHIGLMGRLIFEFGDVDGRWETEVVEMLREDKAELLGGAGSQGALIVGSSLSQIQDPDTRALFEALAVTPEDVLVPMAALELVWCSKRGLQPPLTRLGLMRLRKGAFALLDRNLVLGETQNGIYMHDVVREYGQQVAGAGPLREQQRALVRLLLAASPEGGWPAARTERLGAYVLESMRHHMKGALDLDPDRDPTPDAEALGWLDTVDGFVYFHFSARQAANAIGSAPLVKLAEAALAAGDHGRAGHFFGCAALVDGTAHVSGVGPTYVTPGWEAEPIAEDHVLFRSFEALAAVAAPTQMQRSFELGLRNRLSVPPGGALWGASLMRSVELLNHPGGFVEPTVTDGLMAVAQMVAFEGVLVSGLSPTSPGTQKSEEMQRTQVRTWARSSRMAWKAVSGLEAGEPEWIVQLFSASYGHLCFMCNAFVFPDLLDPGELYSLVGFIEPFFAGRDYPRDHAPLQLAHTLSLDLQVIHAPVELAMLRFGRIALVRDVLRQDVLLADHIRAEAFDAFAWPLKPFSAMLMAGLRVSGAAIFDAIGVSCADLDAHAQSLAPFLKALSFGKALTSAAGDRSTWLGVVDDAGVLDLTFFTTAVKLKAFMFGASGGYTAEHIGSLLDGVRPGRALNSACCDDAYETSAGDPAFWTCVTTMEPEAREALGRHAEAIAAADYLAECNPFAAIVLLYARLVKARSQSAIAAAAASDPSRATFQAVIHGALKWNAPFIAVAAARDLLTAELVKGGRGGDDAPARAAALATIGRAAAAMPGSASDLEEMLRPAGLDAAVTAVAAGAGSADDRGGQREGQP